MFRQLKRFRAKNLLVPAIILAPVWYFVHTRHFGFLLYFFALPFTVLSAGMLYFFEYVADAVAAPLADRVGKLLAVFLLLFFYVIGLVLLFSLTLSFPFGWIMTHVSGSPEFAREFALFSANFVIILGLCSWLRWLWISDLKK